MVLFDYMDSRVINKVGNGEMAFATRGGECNVFISSAWVPVSGGVSGEEDREKKDKELEVAERARRCVREIKGVVDEAKGGEGGENTGYSNFGGFIWI